MPVFPGFLEIIRVVKEKNMSKSKKMTIEEMVDCFRIMFS